MTKPKWLYESLPWIYGGAGLVVMAALRNWMAVLSGGMLLLTGSLVWAMRRRFRRETPQRVRLGTFNLPVRLAWKPVLSLGHELLDRQHRQLFTLCNELISAVGRRKADAVVQALLRELQADMRQHFASEERVASDGGRPLPAVHLQAHAAALARVTQLQARCDAGQIDIDELVRTIAMDVVAGHLVAEAGELARAVAKAPREAVETV